MTHQPIFNSKRLSWTVAAAIATVLAPAASQAVEMTAGDWKFTFSGNVNAHYIVSQCEDSPVQVDGGFTCTAPPGVDDTGATVSDGLLPAAMSFSASTTQSGYDLTANFGLYPGIATNDGSPNLGQGTDPTLKNTALGTTGLDIRQVYLTFGNKSMGTFTVGRNIGLFGADAILGDMTLLGVGVAGGNNAAPNNTSLGSIGFGYIYTDWLAQIDYTTPDISGFKFTIGVFDPIEPLGEQAATPKSSPGFHGKAAYTLGDLYLSASFLSEKQKPLGAPDYTATGFDIGGKYKIGPVDLLAYYYNASGVGTTALFNQGTDLLTGRKRDSDGFLAQVTYTINMTKLGVNYGESNLDQASGEVSPTLVQKNSKVTFGVYHKLTENLTLLGEFTDSESEAQAGGKNKSKTYNVGAFLAF
jgi:predicted porin